MMFTTAICKKNWHIDGANRRLHRIDGDGCCPKSKVNLQKECTLLICSFWSEYLCYYPGQYFP
jgi:hypothetical protein